MKNYYQILGIPRNATDKDIKEAYKKLFAQYDTGYGAHNNKYVESKMAEITIAYNTLINKEKREEYNRILSSILSAEEQQQINRLRFAEHRRKSSPAVYPPARVNRYLVSFVTTLCFLSASLLIIKSGRDSTKMVVTVPIIPAAYPEKNASQSLIAASPEINNQVQEKTTKRNLQLRARPDNTIKSIRVERTKEAAPIQEYIPVNTETYTSFATHYKIGATQKEVLKIQGTPNAIVRYDHDHEEWYYGHSSINFSKGVLTSFQDDQGGLLLETFQ